MWIQSSISFARHFFYRAIQRSDRSIWHHGDFFCSKFLLLIRSSIWQKYCLAPNEISFPWNFFCGWVWGSDVGIVVIESISPNMKQVMRHHCSCSHTVSRHCLLCMTAKEIDFWKRIMAEKHWTIRKLYFNPPLFLFVFPISLSISEFQIFLKEASWKGFCTKKTCWVEV